MYHSIRCRCRQNTTCWPNGKAPDYGSGDSGFESRAGFYAIRAFFSNTQLHTQYYFFGLHFYTKMMSSSPCWNTKKSFEYTYVDIVFHYLLELLLPFNQWYYLILVRWSAPFAMGPKRIMKVVKTSWVPENEDWTFYHYEFRCRIYSNEIRIRYWQLQ